MKVSYEADRYNRHRINRFARPFICIDEPFEEDLLKRMDYEKRMYKTPFGKRITCRAWEEDRLYHGLPNLDMFVDFRELDVLVKAGTVKAAIRQLRKLAPQLPHRTRFEDYLGWKRYGVKIWTNNPGYTEAKAKEAVYKDITIENLPSKFRSFSGVAKMDFTVQKFRDLGYMVEVEWVHDTGYQDYKPEGYWVAVVHGNNLRAAFATEQSNSYGIFRDKIALEAENCFNKWSQAPYSMQIPSNEEEWAEVWNVAAYVSNDVVGFYAEVWDKPELLALQESRRAEYKKYEYNY